MVEDLLQARHAAADELLPWYVNGTLSAGEHARVRRHLDECGTCRDNVMLLSRVESVVSRPMATPILPSRRPEVLLEKIDRLERTGRWLGRMPAVAAASLAVAAVALAIAAATLLLESRDPAIYETVTSESQHGTMDYVLSLEFEAGTGREDRQRVLRELAARDVRLDETSGLYELKLKLTAASLAELERFTSAVEDRPEVRSVRIVALQLPVEPVRERRPERAQGTQ